ncbi:MAG TPA: signal peptidase I [Clostridiales bacterium]|nr:signal peptidase I [Clostridiales bacterium]
MNKLKLLFLKFKLDITFIIAIFIIMILLSNKFVILHVKGSSMSPTYENGDTIILKKHNDIESGDIVVFKSPRSWHAEESKFIKRIMGKKGDVIQISKDSVTINYNIINHKRQCSNINNQKLYFKLSDDEYLVMGDNYSDSNDSISQYCLENEEFLINKENIILYGEELLKIGGIFN